MCISLSKHVYVKDKIMLYICLPIVLRVYHTFFFYYYTPHGYIFFQHEFLDNV